MWRVLLSGNFIDNWLEVCFIKGPFTCEYLSISLERDPLIFYLSDSGLAVNTLGPREGEGG